MGVLLLDKRKLTHFRTGTDHVLLVTSCRDDGTTHLGRQPGSFAFPLTEGQTATASAWSPGTRTGIIALAWGVGYFRHVLTVRLPHETWQRRWLVLRVAPGSLIYSHSHQFFLMQSAVVVRIGTAAQCKSYLITNGAPPTNNVHYESAFWTPPFFGEPGASVPAFYQDSIDRLLASTTRPPDDTLGWLDRPGLD